jgi:RNA-dependent RNA polymerase
LVSGFRPLFFIFVIYLTNLFSQLKYGPRIYQKVSGPGITSKFSADRYNIIKEDLDYLWVRTTDFSVMKSIGQSTSFCWEIEGLSASDIFTSFPRFKEDMKDLILEDGEEFCSLIHTQKISLAAADSDLVETLGRLKVETALMILKKLHKLNSTCYDPVSFVKTQLHVL